MKMMNRKRVIKVYKIGIRINSKILIKEKVMRMMKMMDNSIRVMLMI
jgi:hypothetical protein